MLPGLIAGYYTYEQTHINLEKLAQFAGINLIIDEVINIEPEAQQILCQSGKIINYDVVAIDIGSTPQDTEIQGAKLHAIPAKPVPDLLTQWQKIVNEAQANSSTPVTINIIGGGAGGVELALNMHHRLSNILEPEKLTINLIHRGETILSSQNKSASKQLTSILKKSKINLYLKIEIKQVTSQGLITQLDKKINSNYTFLVTNAQPPSWLQNNKIMTDQKGFILVKNTLQTINYSNIFATGDIATMKENPRPKAGVFAVRQGKPLFQNLTKYLSNQNLISYVPQKKYLNIIGTGEQKAVAIWGKISCYSGWMWYLKEYLDLQFMKKFQF
jgi:pyridine nucleotide-disulfide oxidoreductase family protein